MTPSVVFAPAKLTVSLRMTGLRDDGFHLVEAEMVSLDFGDTLTFSDGDELTMEVASTASRGLAVSTDPDNLIARALRFVGRTASVHVLKRIPAGGGLGGGSADAAAVLRWARRVSDEDVRAAATLGADVSFCVRGGRARVRGIGEQIEALAYESRTYTLLTPPFGVSTPAVYRMWDALAGPTDAGPNELEAAAVAVEPRLAEWRDRLGDRTGVTPVLAGSGSTWFVPGAFPGPELVVATTVPAHTG